MCRNVVLALLAAILWWSPVARGQDVREQGKDDAPIDRLELPAGGLVLVPDERLRVESEEVALARGRTRVTYVIRNQGEDRLTRVVAWPLPEIDMNVIGDGKVELPDTVLRNFALVEATVDGRRVMLQFEARASAFARDLTGLLERAGIPLHPMAPGIGAMLKALSGERLAELEERGAILRDDDHILPNWTLKATALWRQAFDPERPVSIVLSYEPIVGVSEWRPQMLNEWRRTYCIDKDLETEIAARLAKARDLLGTQRLSYTVGHEPGWWAAVPSFRLTIEKPRFDTLIATCWSGLRPEGPTLLVSKRRNFKPDDDIRVLFID